MKKFSSVTVLQIPPTPPPPMEKRRRKSLSIFRPQLSMLTTIPDNVPEEVPTNNTIMKKKSRHSAVSREETPPSPISRVSTDKSLERPSVKSRGKSRPKSIFGSLNSYYSFEDDEKPLTATSSNSTSVDEIPIPWIDQKNMVILHHGEVQVTGVMFRKKLQYLVLTDTHLLRFKSQMKAAEVFPQIPRPSGRIVLANHSRMSSGGSGTDGQIQNDPQTAVSLHNIVSVYKLDDGKPYFSIEVASYDEISNNVSMTSIQQNDPQDAELWLSCIRAAITRSRLSEEVPFGRKAIAHAVKHVDSEADYVPSHFRMFTVTQRASRAGGRTSTEELHKLVSTISYLVIGLNKVHVIPLPRGAKAGSSTSLSEMSGTSYGIASLSAVNLQPSDDSFHLSFRDPLQPSVTLYLASSSAQDIALCLRQAADSVRPLWVEQPFTWQVPKNVEENLLPVFPSEDEDHFSFDRTLAAYCISYNVDPANIRYTVDYQCEDAPEFTLLEPNNPRRAKYTVFELLAIFRSLRYNESFHSISFKQVKLDALHNTCDRFGSEHFSWSSKSGGPLPLPRLDSTPLLVQELQCLALKSTRLRKLDFSDALTRSAREFSERDRGSGICEAIFPLCTLQLTNIDWLCLNGIALSFLDLEYLRAAGARRTCHIRGLELSRCSLTDDALDFALAVIREQEDTVECLDLSNNPARMSPTRLNEHLDDFVRIRKLNLSRFSFESVQKPVLSEQLLMQWKLEYLELSGTTLNVASVESLCAYLMTPQSSTLKTLRLENCRLTSEEIAMILRSLAQDQQRPRKMHLHITGNRIEKKHHRLVQTISQSYTPTHLTMRSLEYNDEKGFLDLLHALTSNKALKYLDISGVSIPFDASKELYKKLTYMFENNHWLKELNISGEVASIEAVTLGRGICEALRGLAKNDALEILRIENQALGHPGAEALAIVLENNTTLREIYCDNNQMGLQAFSTLVNAIQGNQTLLWLAALSKDRHWNRGKIEREAGDYITGGVVSTSSMSTTKSSVRKVLNSAVPGRSSSGRSIEKHSPTGVTEQDVEAAIARIDDSWNKQTERLSEYLTRNYNRTHGLNLADYPFGGDSRPSTGMNSLRTALAAVTLDQTPRAEFDRQLTISPTNGKDMNVEIYEQDEEEGSSVDGLMMA